MLERLRSAWAKGKRNVMVQMPTGTGKTVLLAEVIRQEIFKIEKLKIEKLKIGASQGAERKIEKLKIEALQSAERKSENGQLSGVLIVAHRRELIEQIQETIEKLKIEKLKIEKFFEGSKRPEVERSKYGSSQGAERKVEKLENEGEGEEGEGEEGEGEKGEGVTVCVESIQKLTSIIKNEKLKIKSEKSLKGQAPQGGGQNDNVQCSILNSQFDLIIIDEAHHALAKTYKALWERWPQARFLGLTATPCRLNGAAFTDLFDVLLQSQNIQRFIQQGWLSDFEYVSVQLDSEEMKKVRGLKKRGADGDYQTKELATVMDVPESIEHLYTSYNKYARGKKGIVYAINVEHARHIAEYYANRGVRCAVIDASTPAQVRMLLVQTYLGMKNEKVKMKNEGEESEDVNEDKRKEKREEGLDVLINVDIFSEGFDCPEVEFIQLARPTLSLAKYLQQVGRGMRVSEGKPYVTILDNVGLYQTFGLPTDNRDWQGMFLGRMAGKGDATGTGRPLIIRDEVADKQLVNLDMLHIKRFDEKRTRIEVFLLGGRFGIMLMGQVTCTAQFRRVQRLHHPRYFALAVYDGMKEEYTTVIDNEGRNMDLAFSGKVSVDEDIFIEEDPYGHRTYYDAISKQEYARFPQFMVVAGLEVLELMDAYRLRDWENRPTSFLAKGDTHYNDCIVISNGVLINKTDGNRQSRIRGYLGDSVLVSPEKGIGLQQVRMDGTLGELFLQMPREATVVPDWKRLGLIALPTMSREYVEGKERSMIRMRYDEFVESLVEHNDVYLDDHLGLGFQVHHAGYTEGKNRFIAHSNVLFLDIKTLALDISLDGNTATLTGRQEIIYKRSIKQRKDIYDFRIKMKKKEGSWFISGIWYWKS